MENSAEVPARAARRAGQKGQGTKGTLKLRGELAEMGFMFKAAGLGFGVAKPCGDSERYDFILDSGKRLWRVQVKSTYVTRAHSYTVTSSASTNGKKKAYPAEQIDMLVAYMVAEDAWYVVPVAGFAPRDLRFDPSGSGRGGLYEKYRDAWHLMKAEPCERYLDSLQALGHMLPRKM
jgi:hypothetical protein